MTACSRDKPCGVARQARLLYVLTVCLNVHSVATLGLRYVVCAISGENICTPLGRRPPVAAHRSDRHRPRGMSVWRGNLGVRVSVERICTERAVCGLGKHTRNTETFSKSIRHVRYRALLMQFIIWCIKCSNRCVRGWWYASVGSVLAKNKTPVFVCVTIGVMCYDSPVHEVVKLHHSHTQCEFVPLRWLVSLAVVCQQAVEGTSFALSRQRVMPRRPLR